MASQSINISRRQLFTRKKTSETPHLPWAKEDRFTDMCTQCGACIKNCPEHIIQIGDGGFPVVDFQKGECTFCYQCAEVCPEPLFFPKHEPAWTAKASIQHTCLAKQNVECRSCGEMCETQAIRFKLAVGVVAQPYIESEDCNGCGACVSVCPTDAIQIKLT
ncbi:ferredoxin-type protein NapF [Vibrio hibernica]|uniref:ferredoxin-type protein NapF n=1 Tax=Vibrio hibernica TaxID=2587465 RepID=UPI00188295FA|nr:ferredoxin-type protein NapF [Vibrio hibernica]